MSAVRVLVRGPHRERRLSTVGEVLRRLRPLGVGVTVSLDLGSWLPPEVAELLGEGAGAVLLVGERASGVLRPAAGGAARESAEAAQVGGADVLVQAVPGTGSMRVEVQGSSWLSSLVDRRLGDLSAALAGPSRPTPEPSWSPGATRPG